MPEQVPFLFTSFAVSPLMLFSSSQEERSLPPLPAPSLLRFPRSVLRCRLSSRHCCRKQMSVLRSSCPSGCCRLCCFRPHYYCRCLRRYCLFHRHLHRRFPAVRLYSDQDPLLLPDRNHPDSLQPALLCCLLQPERLLRPRSVILPRQRHPGRL